MKLNLLIIALLAVASGCSPGPSGTNRQVQVAGGGAPVLTTAELAAGGTTAPPREPSRLAQVSFNQPTDESGQSARSTTVKPFDQWNDQDAAEHALGRIGAPAVPMLVEALRSPDAAIRLRAVEVLGRMGGEAVNAVPALIPLLDDTNPDVRRSAARTLGLIGPAAKDAVPSLIRNLFQPTVSSNMSDSGISRP
jgi:hypothetical protein